mmetsp:Transcript_2931/g.7158  ORF Transcript_2931/g.7158 Transcript_2931/m.7158 type:complete len:222 (-) Transcript_2931:1217-1882(-)
MCACRGRSMLPTDAASDVQTPIRSSPRVWLCPCKRTSSRWVTFSTVRSRAHPAPGRGTLCCSWPGPMTLRPRTPAARNTSPADRPPVRRCPIRTLIRTRVSRPTASCPTATATSVTVRTTAAVTASALPRRASARAMRATRAMTAHSATAAVATVPVLRRQVAVCATPVTRATPALSWCHHSVRHTTAAWMRVATSVDSVMRPPTLARVVIAAPVCSNAWR